jgi:hypothetical protein
LAIGLLVAGLSGCGGGSSVVTLTNLDDAEGRLQAEWDSPGALWFDEADTLEGWTLDSETSTLIPTSDIFFYNLQIHTFQYSCDDMNEHIDRSTTLVDGLDEATDTEAICDEISAFIDQLDSPIEESMSLNVSISDFGEAGGGPGTYTEISAGISWSESGADPASAWDADNCTFSGFNTSDRAGYALIDAEMILDEVNTDEVIGTLTGTLDPDSGATGDLDASFNAELCTYGPGAWINFL